MFPLLPMASLHAEKEVEHNPRRVGFKWGRDNMVRICTSASHVLIAAASGSQASSVWLWSCWFRAVHTRKLFSKLVFFGLPVGGNGRAKAVGTAQVCVGQAHGIGLSQWGHQGELSRPTSHSPNRERILIPIYCLTTTSVVWHCLVLEVLGSCFLFQTWEGLKWSKGLPPSFQSC